MNNLNHIAFIMDGNGRWAKARNMPRTYGHSCGVKVIGNIIEKAIESKIENISFFAFSIENWSRPKKEINYLLKLLLSNINIDSNGIKKLIQQGVKLKIIGFRNNLSKIICNSIDKVEALTKNNDVINVNIFFNYSGIADIESAFKKMISRNCGSENIKDYLLTKDLPNVDLLIRTSGENRISNFMLYELAYSEIIFENTLWPDYNIKIFSNNLKEYNNRNRKFGKVNGK